ncbi:hypothetical protein PHPALM_27986 [Phytophthora palmivora]|uniref:Uncharacterized protein n=1 Tax=Phytophthora palmivora TaxID=4796 RepID=A0A2P4XB69_9STRA|nr:hypothetical protein PHPALM_27986 [Phytophthora palmivora]
MKNSFDLYDVQLKTFLTRLELWSVVYGSDTRPLFDIEGQAAFDARDNAARDAILRGVPDADAKMICHEVSAKDLWPIFENKQTKREYADYIFAREQLYSNKYTLLLGNVSQTLREVVRQFSRHFAVLAIPGAHQMAPTSAQIMIALRAEEDLDERVAEEMPQSSIGSADKKSSNTPPHQNSGDSGKSNAKPTRKGKRQRGRGRYKAKSKCPAVKPTSGKKSDGC